MEGPVGLPVEGQVVGLGPGDGILGLDDRDRVRGAVGDIRNTNVAAGLEQSAGADEPAVGCRVRLRIRTTGTLVDKGHVLQELLVMGAVPGLVELELVEEYALLHIGQDRDPPAQQRLAVLVGDVAGKGSCSRNGSCASPA